MTRIQAVLFAILWAQTVLIAAAQPDVSKLAIDPRSPRSEIRKQLLHYTKVGSTLAEVKKFVSDKLSESGNNVVNVELASSSALAEISHDSRATRFIRVFIGQYYDQPGVIFLTAPMISQKEVSVWWLFDSHDSLIDIAVIKKATVY